MATAITYSTDGGRMSESASAFGKAVADGLVFNVSCGFLPTKIILHLDASSDVQLIWHAGMPAGYYWNGSAIVTSGGPILYVGDDDPDAPASQGFTVPAALVADTDVVYWEAMR